MLPHTYRWYATYYISGSGRYIGIKVTVRRWRFVDGTKVYDDERVEWDVPANSSGLGGVSAADYSSTIDNSSGEWEGADVVVWISSDGAATFRLKMWMQVSTDGGTTWAFPYVPVVARGDWGDTYATETTQFSM